MPYSITFDHDRRIIRGKVTGKINQNLIWQYAIEMKTMIEQEKVNLILSDYREAQISFSMVEIFNIPDQHNEVLSSVGMNVHALKRAILFNNRKHDLVQFFENVVINRGHYMKTFGDESEALAWLLKKPDDQ
jgi:hypothetical protein